MFGWVLLCNRCGAASVDGVVSGLACRVVELGHEFAVGRAGGDELVFAFLEFEAQVQGLLFEVRDGVMERVDVGGCAEA